MGAKIRCDSILNTCTHNLLDLHENLYLVKQIEALKSVHSRQTIGQVTVVSRCIIACVLNLVPGCGVVQ